MTNLPGKRNLPLHVAIVMDGNRRWAKKRGLPAAFGHSSGAEALKKLATYCNKIGLKYLTVYAFSTENWNRSVEEISALMSLFKKQLKNLTKNFKSTNMKIKFLGDISKFSPDLRELILTVEKETSNKDGMQLNIAMNYGSHTEIVNTAKILAKKAISGEINPEDITEKILAENLYTKNCPEVDLFIRTSGEKRISNFMLWQSAYAEFYFTDVLWPDFSENEFDKAISEYFSRIRRFGE